MRISAILVQAKDVRQPDVLLPAALLALGQGEAMLTAPNAPLWQQALLTVAWTVPLFWRRRWPVPVLAVVTALGPVLSFVNPVGGVNSYALSAILAAYTVGRELDPPTTWWGPVWTVGFNWTVIAILRGVLSDFIFVALLYGGAWAVGRAFRRRDAQVARFAQEAEQLRRAQAERQQRAVLKERARIARELHDIVSHSISVITIQTQAVRRRLGPQNAAEIDDLRAVEMTARQAMAEMRRLLGVLRADGDAPSLAPQPGLDQLARLVAESRSLGVPVELQVVGQPVPLSPGVDLAAYRIAQEALTNARKHAANAQTVAVVVRYAPGCLDLQIDSAVSTRTAGPPEDAASSGHGLVGMRERVALYGGTLVAGEGADGAFCVRARLPLHPTEVGA